MTLRALIFDVDGTLAETEEAHRQAFNETFAAHGLGWDWSRDDYRRLLRTTGGKERIRAWLSEIGTAGDAVDVPALHAAKTERYVAKLRAGGLALREGVAALVTRARAAGLGVLVTPSLYTEHEEFGTAPVLRSLARGALPDDLRAALSVSV
ncbi:Haloacid dehalogenase-like hydrolase [Salipiger thiooxidans]|uniref:Haloacid dehalogenase-like hydrolase n=1 Tax=Salipiger thiooxidans TaxID=282683 RepID=A0A1G7ACV5_9RHOB|nr:HAD family hydrolase [Salipiger thiooxidans]SDE12651.1 Haloacid dehalogenase-like hydrolase [Salipiger thiooxidans]